LFVLPGFARPLSARLDKARNHPPEQESGTQMRRIDTTDASTDRWALLAAGVTVLLWASAFVAIRAAAPHYSPGALALGRVLTASAVLAGILLVRREGWPSRAAWPGIISSGVLWFGVYMVILNWGEETVDAGTAAMIISSSPILVALLGSWLLNEKLSRFLLIGLAVSFTGTILVGLSVSDGGRNSVFGMLLCVIAAVSFAAAMVCQKPALRHGSALQITTFSCIVAALACLPFTGQLTSQLFDAPASATLNMLYLGVFPTALAFSTWAYALARVNAGKLSVTTYVVPALVVVMSWVALDEVPGSLAYGGGLLCLAGVVISRMRARPLARGIASPEPAALEPAAPQKSATVKDSTPVPSKDQD
jgi:drug/metabolite transporter (DMT)-like permease